ncbi:MAG: 50S ribosomal protein L20 [Lentisphaerae bacterium]|jgi:large subunit ribosomal protein L20|nr:50S ribosomal protein L20 [Lentisphaerota bacterium]
MPRTTYAVPSRKRRKRVLRQAKGYRGNRSKLIRVAYDAVDRAMANAYVGRKQKKRQYRRLWTVRINAACRAADFKYSWLIDGLTKAGIEINRKVLAELAVNDPAAFTQLIEQAKAAR